MLTQKSKIAAMVATIAISLPAVALAHAELVKSEPAKDGTLLASAKEIVFTFDEAVTPAACKLTTADGKDVASLGKPHADGMVLHIPIAKPLAGGKYSIGCRVVGPDSHPINESISFAVSETSAK